MFGNYRQIWRVRYEFVIYTSYLFVVLLKYFTDGPVKLQANK